MQTDSIGFQVWDFAHIYSSCAKKGISEVEITMETITIKYWSTKID